KRERGPGGRALAVERRAHRRSAALHMLLGLMGREALHEYPEPSRGRKPGPLTVRQGCFRKPRAEPPDERLLPAHKRPRRQLLAADLNQEIVMRALGARCARHARACAPRAVDGAIFAGAAAASPAFSSGNPRASRLAR